MWLYLVCVAFPACRFAGLTIRRWRCIRTPWRLTRLLTESAKWEKVLERFSDKEMNEMHLSFLKKVGGTTDEKEIAKNVIKNKEKSIASEERVSTYEKTLALIAKKLSLIEIAQKRGMTLGTIISHLEKLKEKNQSLDLSPYKPKEKDFKAMSDAFKKSTRPDQSVGEETKFLPSTDCWTTATPTKNCDWQGCFVIGRFYCTHILKCDR